MQVINGPEEKIRFGDLLAILGLCAVIAYLSGCGYAFIPIPKPGERVSIISEQRINSVYETALDVAEEQVNPVSAVNRLRRR